LSYELVYTRQARKDAKKLRGTPLARKASALLELIREDPFSDPPPFEALVGDLKGAYSRRINIQHRLVYQVFQDEQVVKVIRLWTHYEYAPTREKRY
jgi:toxin YoeB